MSTNKTIIESMHKAATEIYWASGQAKKPWVSHEILELMHRRQNARTTHNYDDERKLHKQIRGCIKANKKKWLMTN